MSRRATSRAALLEPAEIRLGQRATVLVVDDEEDVLAATRKLLESFEMTVVTATSTAEVLQVLDPITIDLALLDWRLKGQDDGISLGRMLCRSYGIPFVLFSKYLDTEVTGNAYKVGASDVVNKPLRPDRLLTAVNLALRPRRLTGGERIAPITIPCGSSPVSSRWVEIVLRGCRAEKDPRTEDDVAAANNTSTSVYRKVCKACDVGGKNTTDLVRFLRALSRSKEDGSMLRSHLANSDPKPLRRLFELAGVPTNSRFVPLRQFLGHQKFIPTGKECFREMAHQLANDPLFFHVSPEEPHPRKK